MALNFNGAQRVQFGDLAAYVITGDLSICYWVYFTGASANSDYMVNIGTSGEGEINNLMVRIQTQGSDGSRDLDYLHEYSTGSDEQHTFNTNIASNIWTHVALVRDVSANTVDLYINGELFESWGYTNDPTSTATTLPFSIGAFDSDSNDFQDPIGGPMMLANVAWTAGEVRDAFAGKKIFRGLQVGSHLYAPGDLSDFSGNNRNGTAITGTTTLFGNPPSGQSDVFNGTLRHRGSDQPAEEVTEGRVTKVLIEALGQTDPAGRVTKVVVEVLSSNLPPTQGTITQSAVEVLATNANAQAQLTQSVIEALAQSTEFETRVSQYSVELLVPLDCDFTTEEGCPDLPPPCPVPNVATVAGPDGCAAPQPAPASPECVGIVPQPPCPEVD